MLGQQDLPASVARAKQMAAAYQPLSRVPVIPAFEIIATVAEASPGADGNYTYESPVSSLLPWVSQAATAGMYVVLVLIDPPNLPGWHGVRLKDRLSRCFPGIPVCIEHDGNAGALAEFHFGAARGRGDVRHLIFLTFGTGLGAGLIVNGQILHGASDTAGEIGHWRLSRSGPEGFGKTGSWEGFSSGAGLVKLAASIFPQRWQAQTPIRTLVDAMLADDPRSACRCDRSRATPGPGSGVADRCA